MQKFQPSRSPCPIGRASRIFGDRWIILILREAMLGATRFEEFLPNTGINRAALTSRLVTLVEHGLLKRVPPTGRKAEYLLTKAGRETAPVMAELRLWGERWLITDQDDVALHNDFENGKSR